MFRIDKQTNSHVVITSDNNRECAFTIDIFEKSKKRKPRDVKRNRVIAQVNGVRHVFKQKEWNDAVKRSAYQVIRENYEAVVDGTYQTCVILGFENDFVIMPVDELRKAKVEE